MNKLKPIYGWGKSRKQLAIYVIRNQWEVISFATIALKRKSRIINYHYYSWQKICSIGSGAVESAVKQIAHRVKITGAQWNAETVNNILQLRCAYLNGQLAI